MKRSVMGEQHGGMGAAEGIAGENGSVESRAGEWLQCDVVGETWRRAADRAGNFPCRSAQRGEGNGEFDEPAAAERVAEAAFPGNQRCTGELPTQDLGLEPACLQRAGAVAFDPNPPPAHRGGNRGGAGGKAGAV